MSETCCPYGETTLCQHGWCDECAYRQQHNQEAHERDAAKRAQWEMSPDDLDTPTDSDGVCGCVRKWMG